MSKFRRLEKHRTGGTDDKMELSIPLPRTSSGKSYRLCKNEECVPRLFLLADNTNSLEIKKEFKGMIKRIPGEPGTTCPYCGLDGDDQDFIHPADIESAQKYVEWAAVQDMEDQVVKILKGLETRNRSSSGISIKVNVEKSRRFPPHVWREDLLRNLSCDICGREYGVYAIALLCPDCGAPNIHVHFQRELELVEKQIELAGNVDENDQELAYRLLGNAHEDILTAFETYLKAIYKYLIIQRFPKEEADKLVGKKAIGNAFQNIERGSKLFNILGLNLYKDLLESDIEFLKLNIDKRHVVGHNLSIADEAYSTTADKEDPGTTVTLLSDEMNKFGQICFSIVKGLEVELIPKE